MLYGTIKIALFGLLLFYSSEALVSGTEPKKVGLETLLTKADVALVVRQVKDLRQLISIVDVHSK